MYRQPVLRAGAQTPCSAGAGLSPGCEAGRCNPSSARGFGGPKRTRPTLSRSA